MKKSMAALGSCAAGSGSGFTATRRIRIIRIMNVARVEDIAGTVVSAERHTRVLVGDTCVPVPIGLGRNTDKPADHCASPEELIPYLPE